MEIQNFENKSIMDNKEKLDKLSSLSEVVGIDLCRYHDLRERQFEKNTKEGKAVSGGDGGAIGNQSG